MRTKPNRYLFGLLSFKQHLALLRCADKPMVDTKLYLKGVFPFAEATPDSTKIGKYINVNGLPSYLFITSVSGNNNIGYRMAWKSIIATSKSVLQFSLPPIIGADNFAGNVDGSFYISDAFPKTRFKITHIPEVVKYGRPNKDLMITEFKSPIPARAIKNSGATFILVYQRVKNI